MSGWEGCQSIRVAIFSDFHPIEKGEGISPWMVLSYFICLTTAMFLFELSKELLSRSHVAERYSSCTAYLTGILLLQSK